MVTMWLQGGSTDSISCYWLLFWPLLFVWWNMSLCSHPLAPLPSTGTQIKISSHQQIPAFYLCRCSPSPLTLSFFFSISTIFLQPFSAYHWCLLECCDKSFGLQRCIYQSRTRLVSVFNPLWFWFCVGFEMTKNIPLDFLYSHVHMPMHPPCSQRTEKKAKKKKKHRMTAWLMAALSKSTNYLSEIQVLIC